jgi:hypothetical protein
MEQNNLKLTTDELQKYHTIFGFDTTNKIAAQAIDIIYWFIIFVAYCFAFHALDTILISWNWLLVGLASFAVVGLPYCVKIILFGRKEFPLKAAILCLFLSLLPTIFDFAGFYSETGLVDSLNISKKTAIESLGYFEAESKKAAQKEKTQIAELERAKIKNIEVELSKSILTVNKQIDEANQKIIDEKTGVRSKLTSGKPGEGPRTKELEADVRKLQAQSELETRTQKENTEKGIEVLRQDTASKIENIDASVRLLDEKVIETKKIINNAKTFTDLETAVIDANSLMSSIASNLSIKFIPVEIIGSANILRLSFESLLRFEVTAVVCLLLALLMEIGDIVIVFVIRYEKPKAVPKIISKNTSYKEKLFTKTYEGY